MLEVGIVRGEMGADYKGKPLFQLSSSLLNFSLHPWQVGYILNFR